MFFRKKFLVEEIKQVESDFYDKVHTLCFTGHRSQKLPWGYNENDERCVCMRNRTRVEIENAIKSGYHTFLCGMALGFDMICAELVLELKKKYPHIKLIGAIPCKNQDSLWPKSQQERYKKLVKQLDGVRCIYDEYEDGCMLERNDYMLNNSSLVIALYNGKGGGTGYTIKKAKEKNLNIIIIKP